MITEMKELGSKILENQNDRDKEVLLSQAIAADNSEAREIVINLNTKKDRIEIYQGDELSKGREHFFGFPPKAPNGPKIAFTTNNAKYHLNNTVPDIIDYIEKNLENEKYKKFLDYLYSLKKQFYLKKGKKYSLNLNKLYNQKNKPVVQESSTAQDSNKILLTKLLGISNKEIKEKNYNVVSLKINGEYIHNSHFSKEYKNVLWHQRFRIFFDKNLKKDVHHNKLCHICGQKKEVVTGSLDIDKYTKFYNIDKANFFENLSNKYYKSFSMCKDCFKETLVGVNYIKENLRSALNRTPYIIIPKNISYENTGDIEKITHFLKRIIFNNKNIKEEIKNNKELIESSKYRDFKFDLIFFEQSNAEFKVLKQISDLRFSRVVDVANSFKNMNDREFLNALEFFLSPNDMYFLMFPNKNSENKKPDPKEYRKELLDMLESLYTGRKMNYNQLIRRFNTIFRKTFHRNKKKYSGYWLNPLKMNLLTEILKNTKNLKFKRGDSNMKTFTEIDDKDTKKYFEINSNVYNDKEKQGLFLLGQLIGRIASDQRKSGQKEMILNKIDFDGMQAKHLIRLINEIKAALSNRTPEGQKRTLFSLESEKIALMDERLVNIKNSKLSKDEITYYILSGISFSKYLGIKYKKEGGKK